MRAVCSGTRGRGCCGWSDMVRPPEITAPTPLSTFRLTYSPTVSDRLRDGRARRGRVAARGRRRTEIASAHRHWDQYVVERSHERHKGRSLLGGRDRET